MINIGPLVDALAEEAMEQYDKMVETERDPLLRQILLHHRQRYEATVRERNAIALAEFMERHSPEPVGTPS